MPNEQCPYVGLAAFHEGREKYFFGRERLLSTLVEEARLVAVVGPSGSGKSSLVLARSAQKRAPFPVTAVRPAVKLGTTCPAWCLALSRWPM